MYRTLKKERKQPLLAALRKFVGLLYFVGFPYFREREKTRNFISAFEGFICIKIQSELQRIFEVEWDLILADRVTVYLNSSDLLGEQIIML